MSEKNDKIDWLDNLHNSSKRLRELSWYLQDLANSFLDTGNNIIYKKLLSISDDLIGISESVNNSAGKVVNEMLERSQQSSKTMFEAVLAGMKISNDNNSKNKQ